MFRHDRPLPSGIPRVDGGRWLEEENGDLGFGNRHMLHPSGDDEELPLTQGNVAIAESHGEGPLKDEEHLVFVWMGVPNEVPRELHELDVAGGHLPNDGGPEVIFNLRELVSQVDL